MPLFLNKDDLEKINSVKSILENELRYHYTINDLARRVGINTLKLKVGFKQMFNISPYQYLTKIRIDKGKHLLETTGLPVKRISSELGFPHPTNFIRRFKMLTNLSPGEWRKNCTLSS